MTEYWIVKPDEIKNLDADTMSPLEFSNFRHGEYFEKHQGAYYYSTDKMAHVSLLDATSELSAPFIYKLVDANYPYDGLEGARSSVDLVCDATEAKREGASEALLQNRLDYLTQGRPSERQYQNLQTWTKPREEWREQDAYFVVHDGQGLVTLAPQNEMTELIQNSEYQLQLTQDGEWTYGVMGTGIWLGELAELQKTLTPILTDAESYQVIRDQNLKPQAVEAQGFVEDFIARSQSDQLMVGHDGQMEFDFGPDFARDLKEEVQKLQPYTDGLTH